MVHLQATKQYVIDLRRDGKSLNEIAKVVGISKSTASLWSQGVLLTSQQKNFLKWKQLTGKQKSVEMVRSTQTILLKKLEKKIDLKLQKFPKSEFFYKLLSSIFIWTEGAKK